MWRGKLFYMVYHNLQIMCAIKFLDRYIRYNYFQESKDIIAIVNFVNHKLLFENSKSFRMVKVIQQNFTIYATL